MFPLLGNWDKIFLGMKQTFNKFHLWKQENPCAIVGNQQAVCSSVVMQRKTYFTDNIDKCFKVVAGEHKSF